MLGFNKTAFRERVRGGGAFKNRNFVRNVIVTIIRFCVVHFTFDYSTHSPF